MSWFAILMTVYAVGMLWMFVAFLIGDVTHHRLIELLEDSDTLQDLAEARTVIHYPFVYDFFPFPLWARIKAIETKRAQAVAREVGK